MNDTQKALRKHCEFVRDELHAIRDNVTNELEDCTIYDYLSEALDVEYRLDSNLQLRGVEVSVTLGGPNVWIDTYAETVEGAWGAERVSLPLDRDICNEIDNYYEEYLRCFINR